MENFKVILTPKGEGLPGYEVFCECGCKVTRMLELPTAVGRNIAPVCDACGNRGGFSIHKDGAGAWMAESL